MQAASKGKRERLLTPDVTQKLGNNGHSLNHALGKSDLSRHLSQW